MDIIIKNSAQEPIYQQIQNQIKKMIITGELRQGEALPSIRNLARDLQVSVITTKRAYEELESEGLIETVGGKGTFVAGPAQEYLQEKRMLLVEEKLAAAVEEAKLLGIKRVEMHKLLDVLYEEE